VRRREFIAGLGSAAAWSCATRAQQAERVRRIGVGAGDVFANGIVKNLARPEGNTTGVTAFFYSFGGKWLELLKEAVPRIETVALIYNAQLVPNV
jgi:ABC-type uncharacterized transport system substrate-binding protein